MAEPAIGIPSVYAEEIQIEDGMAQENAGEGNSGMPVVDNGQDDSILVPDNNENQSGSELLPGSNGDQKDEEKTDDSEKNNDNTSNDDGVQGSEDSETAADGDGAAEGSGEGDVIDTPIEDGEDASEGEITDDGIPEENISDEDVSDEDASGETETSEKDLTGEEKEEAEGFSDMPSGYKLTSFQRDLKADMSSTVSSFNEDEEGETFAESEVITFADSEDEAEAIAEAYHAEIVSFNMGVLVLRLSEGNTVKSALVAASDMDNNLPPVWPNYRRELYGEAFPDVENDVFPELEIVEEEYSIDGADMEAGKEGIPSLEAYGQVLNELGGYTDPYLNPDEDRYQWFHTAVGSPYAWSAGYKGDGIKVGVIDSGMDSNEDLDGNIFGRMDFCDGTSDAADAIGHGTHVGGTIAALGNGYKGIGVAPEAKIFNARVFGEDSSKSGYDSTIIAAIQYLIGEEENATSEKVSSVPARVDIINMSLGGPGRNDAFQAVLDKAYRKGVVVIAATGNDGGSLSMYPASYNHVIGVSATDTNNERAYFSNYGASTDLSAPGVRIWATLNNNYASSQGTSMACPVVSGEAAVILSGQDVLPALKNKSGQARVDALESVMKANAVAVGSGMGSGVTSLPKVFNLSIAAAKPNAPEIKIDPDGTKQSVTVTLRAQEGMKLCYTVDGKNPGYKNGTPDGNTVFVDGNEVTFAADCSESAKGTVKAIAVNPAGVISSVKSQSYTLYPYVQTITVSGAAKVEKGKSIQLAVAITPAYAANKKVTWELTDSQGNLVDPSKVKIDAKGKVTAAKNADTGTYTVTVRAQDEGRRLSEPYTVQVVEAGTAVQSLVFDKKAVKELWITESVPEPSLELSQFLVVKEKSAGALVQIDNSKLQGRLNWTSSKPTVASVDKMTGVVTGKQAGTVTITAKASDSGNKKTSIKITVKQAVTGITITTNKGVADGNPVTVAAGKSITLKAAVNPAKPANKKVVWSIDSPTSDVSVNGSSGKITVKPGAAAAIYTVKAAAADGKGAAATQQVRVCSGAIGEIRLDTPKVTLYTKKEKDKTNTATVKATLKGTTDFDPGAYTVTSSNEAVVKAVSGSNADGTVEIKLTATGDMYGKANIVIAATDGSNKKASCAVTVKGDITKAELLDGSGNKVSKLTLFRGGTNSKVNVAELNAAISASEGANREAYEVTSSNPALVSVATDKTTGKIVLRAGSRSTGKATVTLMATDGSKKKAICTVTVCNPASRINIAPKAGTTAYVVPGKSVQLTATMETENGAVANKGVTWSLPAELIDSGITVSQSGKVSVDQAILVSQVQYVKVTATAKDGSGVATSYNVYVAPPTTRINLGNPSTSKGVCRIPFTSDCTSFISCTSSAPEVISPTISYKVYNPSKKTGGSGTITFVTANQGMATITIKALDSTNKTVSKVIRIN